MDILGIVVSIVFVFLVIGISTLLTKKGVLKDEGARKFIHIGVSNWWILAVFFFTNRWTASIVPALFVVINFLSYRKSLFSAMEREEKEKSDLGTVYYAISLVHPQPDNMGDISADRIGSNSDNGIRRRLCPLLQEP